MNHAKVLKKSLLIFIPLLLVIIISCLILYYSRTDANYKILANSEKNRLQILSKYLDSDLEAIISDLSYLLEITPLSGQQPVEFFSFKEDCYYFSKSRKIYDQIRILDSEGMEKLRINYNSGSPEIVPQNKLQNKKGRYYFDDTFALNRGEVFISPLDLNIEHGEIEMPFKPMIRFGMPLFDKNGHKKGILLLNYLASQLLDRIKDFQQTSLGNSYLINEEGYYLYAENPDLAWGFMFPGQARDNRTLLNDSPTAWERINRSQNGQFEISAGLYTYSTIFPMTAGNKSSTGSGYAKGGSSAQRDHREYYWKLVTFIPQQKLYAYNRSLKATLIYFFIVSAAVIGIGSYRFTMAKQSGEEARAEIKTLQGIIPICMYCKEIRDDEGAWNRLENYIETHSDAQFSHGICDNCLKERHAGGNSTPQSSSRQRPTHRL